MERSLVYLLLAIPGKGIPKGPQIQTQLRGTQLGGICQVEI